MKACLEGRNLKGDLQDNIELTSLCSSGRHVRRKAAPSKSAISFILDSRLKENQKSLEDPGLGKKKEAKLQSLKVAHGPDKAAAYFECDH